MQFDANKASFDHHLIYSNQHDPIEPEVQWCSSLRRHRSDPLVNHKGDTAPSWDGSMISVFFSFGRSAPVAWIWKKTQLRNTPKKSEQRRVSKNQENHGKSTNSNGAIFDPNETHIFATFRLMVGEMAQRLHRGRVRSRMARVAVELDILTCWTGHLVKTFCRIMFLPNEEGPSWSTNKNIKKTQHPAKKYGVKNISKEEQTNKQTLFFRHKTKKHKKNKATAKNVKLTWPLIIGSTKTWNQRCFFLCLEIIQK